METIKLKGGDDVGTAEQDFAWQLGCKLARQKAIIHRGKNADWVHGYWKAIDDIARHYGITITPKTSGFEQEKISG
jgi:hypothetical protein